MKVLGKYVWGVVITALIAGGSTSSTAGTITITERESLGKIDLFAGSGGAVDSYANQDDKADLTGSFSFSDAWSVGVYDSDQYSLGTATAVGSISVTDSVTQSSASSLSLTATRSATSGAEWFSGSASSSATLGQTFRVRFTTGADPVDYVLTGDFDPGATTGVLGEAGVISLRRPFTATKPIHISTAMSGIFETGTIPANQTYEFIVAMNDKTIANAGNPVNADSSSLDIALTLTSVPEPASACLLAGCCWVLLTRKPRRPVK